MKNLTYLAAMAIVLILTACSHIRVVGFDKQANTVTVQGGKWASEAEIQKEAEKYCGGSVTLLRMGQRQVATYTQANVQSFGSSASGQATTVGIHRNDYTYSCNGH